MDPPVCFEAKPAQSVAQAVDYVKLNEGLAVDSDGRPRLEPGQVSGEKGEEVS